MNADLEATLNELGPGYGPLVARLRASAEAEPPARVRPSRPAMFRPARLAAALAGVCLLAGAMLLLHRRPDAESAPAAGQLSPYALAYERSPAALAEILRTQAADGSWANDFLTRQNAAVLQARAHDSIACRKAVRYLRTRGLAPLTPEELEARLGRG